MLPVAGLVVVALLAGLWFITRPTAGTTLTAVLVDKSKSASDESPAVRAAATRAAARGAQSDGGYLLIDRIGDGRSDLSWAGSVDCDSGNKSVCEEDASAQSKHIDRATRRLLAAPNDAPTDMLGALRGVESYVDSIDRKVSQVHVEVIGDAIQTVTVDLEAHPPTTANASKLVDLAHKAQALPTSCKGWVVDVYGAVQAKSGTKYTPQFVAGVEAFWREALSRCGGRLGAWAPASLAS